MNIIGISGQIGSGKDSIADYFIDKHGYQKHAFADPLKEFLAKIFEFSQEQLWGPSEKRNETDVRYDNSNSESWEDAKDNLKQFGPSFVNEVVTKVNKRPVALQKLFDWFHWLRENQSPLSPRVCLQSLGSEWGRSIDADIWASYLLVRAQRSLSSGVPAVIVSDVRLRNELQAIRDVGGKLIKVVRSSTDQEASNIGLIGHSSEQEQKSFLLAEFDFVIINDGSLDDLFIQVDKIVEQLVI